MKITDVRVRRIIESERAPQVKAVVSITLDDQIAVHDIRVIEKEDKTFIAMPRLYVKNGVSRDTVHPTNAETRRELESAIIEAYHAELARREAASTKDSNTEE